MVILDVLKLILVVIIAFFVGKLVSKIKLPAILGWLITGMILGPHAFSIIDNNLLDATWYNVLESILECTVGLMIGTELIWRKMKKAGKQIVVTTITESIGTFIVVSLVFGVIFWFANVSRCAGILYGYCDSICKNIYSAGIHLYGAVHGIFACNIRDYHRLYYRLDFKESKREESFAGGPRLDAAFLRRIGLGA